MLDEDENGSLASVKPRITVVAADIDGAASALDMKLIEEPESVESPDYSAELRKVLDTLADIYAGVQLTTENDRRGRSRKMVRQYADREDFSSDDVGHILRVLEETTSLPRTAIAG